MTDYSNIRDKYLSDFQRLAHLHSNGMGELRSTAIRNFERLGFPTVKNEEWKYTNIAPLLKTDYAQPEAINGTSRAEIANRLGLSPAVSIVVLENGRLLAGESDATEGIEITTLDQSKEHPVKRKYFAKHADVKGDAFAALNTAFFAEGIFVHVPAGIQAKKPVVIVNVSSHREEAVISHSRLLLVAAQGSSAKVAWVTLSKNENTLTFVNAVNEIVAEENASLEFDLFQDENDKAYQICNTHVYQQQDSRFTINTATLGGNIVRNTLHLNLDGNNCETHLYGLYVASGNQLVDNHTSVLHAMPHSNSNQLYKGIIGGKAHGVFNGKIFVAKDAQKTNAYQSNKNILLSNDAVVNAKPQLEIFADDVKCTHGATTGQMDEESLFYLRSRGINELQAKALLNQAFASDILNNITITDLREAVTRSTGQKLIEAHAS